MKVSDIKTTTVVDRSHSMMCWFCTFHRSHMCLHVDCESFKLASWTTLRQKFMNFWSFLTRSGEKHDKKISNCSSTPCENSIEFCHRYTFIHGSHSVDHVWVSCLDASWHVLFFDLSFLNLARSTSYTSETYLISSPWK